MEEKKKRWRPSLAAYRKLERDLEDQVVGTGLLVRQCNEWRDGYRELLAENERLGGELERLRARGLWKRILNR